MACHDWDNSCQAGLDRNRDWLLPLKFKIRNTDDLVCLPFLSFSGYHLDILLPFTEEEQLELIHSHCIIHHICPKGTKTPFPPALPFLCHSILCSHLATFYTSSPVFIFKYFQPCPSKQFFPCDQSHEYIAFCLILSLSSLKYFKSRFLWPSFFFLLP